VVKRALAEGPTGYGRGEAVTPTRRLSCTPPGAYGTCSFLAWRL